MQCVDARTMSSPGARREPQTLHSSVGTGSVVNAPAVAQADRAGRRCPTRKMEKMRRHCSLRHKEQFSTWPMLDLDRLRSPELPSSKTQESPRLLATFGWSFPDSLAASR